MGTRIKKNPSHVFEIFCEITIPSDLNQAPWISWMFPYNYKNDEILKSVPGFAYPCEFTNSAVQHFSFVLTNIDSQWTFGFCRHAANSATCYVILSYLPWHEVFFKVLNHVADLSSKEKAEKSKDLHLFLENLYHAQIPDPGLELHVLSSKNEDFVAVSADNDKLPSIPENRNMTEYFNAVDAHNMMTIFASMLHERRILITSKKLSRLSACVQAANSLIYPMHWQHIFIPVLPKHLTDYLSAPMPFLIGIPASTLARLKSSDLGDVVFLDADENRIETPFADLDALPSEILQSLRHDLKRPQEMLGDAVARAFLRALVKLIGGYWNALKLKPGEKITFSPELFVQTRPSAMQPFLQKMLELQLFQQFIDCRLKRLNSGQGVTDEFEFELTAHEDKASFRLRNQYREWVSNMKKEGGAFLKNVRTKVKDTSKKAYKDIRSRIQDMHNHKVMTDEPPEVPKRRGSAPNSVSNGVDIDIRKHVKSAYKKENFSITKVKETTQSTQYSALCETKSKTPEVKDSKKPAVDSPQLTFQPIDMDLMGDLHELIFRRCSLCNDSPMKRTSASDSQLIDLSGDSEIKPCSPACAASQLKSLVSDVHLDPAPPPLLPRPPSSKSRPFALSSSTSSDLSECNPKLLIELDDDTCSSERSKEDIFTITNDLANNSLNEPTANSINLKPTNPFYENSLSVPCQGDLNIVYKSSSGPNVRNMINMWQSPPSIGETQGLSTSADKLKSVSSVTAYKSQLLSRTVSTPPAISSVYSAHPSVVMLKSASKVSTNPFIVADHQNNNSKENLNSSNSSWESFH